jgi:hypothetical protein
MRRCDETRAWLDQVVEWNDRQSVGLSDETIVALATASVQLSIEASAAERRMEQ